MENVREIKTNPIDIFQEDLFRCEKCEKVFKIKSSLSRHLLQKHGQVDLLKLKLKNEHLSLKVDLYLEQIKFLKDHIIIQESLRIQKLDHPKNPLRIITHVHHQFHRLNNGTRKKIQL